jgi:hypothetical protein
MSSNSTVTNDLSNAPTPAPKSNTPGPTIATENKHLACNTIDVDEYIELVNQQEQAMTTAATVPRVPPRKPSSNRRKAKHKLLPYSAPKKGTSHRYKPRSKTKRKPPQCPKRQGLLTNQIGTAKPETDGHFNNSKVGEHNKIPTSHWKKHGYNVAPACKGVLIPHSGLVNPGTV